MLRNRKTNEHYTYNGLQLFSEAKAPTSSSYFKAVPTICAILPQTLRTSVEDVLLQQTTTDVSDELKIERAKKFVALVQAIEEQVSQGHDDPAKVQEQMQIKLNEMNQDVKKAQEESDSFIKTLGWTLGSAALNNYLPGSGLLLALLPMAAATVAPGKAVVVGMPPGKDSIDLCNGNLQCGQGYITPSDDPSVVLGQFSRTVSSTIAGKGVDIAFLDCLSVNKIGEAVSYLYANSTNGGQTCFANSIVVSNTQASVQATSLFTPNNNCNILQNQVNPVFNACQNYSSDVGKWIGVGFAAFVGVAALAAGITLLVCCCSNRSNRNCC